MDVVQYGGGYGQWRNGDWGSDRLNYDHGCVWVNQREGYADGDAGFEFDQCIPEHSQCWAGWHAGVHGHGAL